MAIRTVRPLDEEEWEAFTKELNKDPTPEEIKKAREMIEMSKGMKTIR